MILTQKEILREISEKRIIIEPLDKAAIGPASIDLTLDNSLRLFNKTKIIDGDADYKSVTKLIRIKKDYILKPGEFVLGITKEKITLPNNICGWLNSRSKYARIGLMSHVTAPFIAPGVSNKQVLEIYNLGKNKIRLIPGTKICQIVLEKCIGKAQYNGKWKNQEL